MAIVQPTVSRIGVTEGPSETAIILIALFIAFGAAAYFTGRLYGRYGMMAVGGGFVAVVVGLFVLGGLRF
jgi:hypothetical protein